MTLVSQACGTKFNLGNTDGLLRQKSGCRNYIGRDTAVCIGRLVMVSDGVIGDIPWEYINISFITFVGAHLICLNVLSVIFPDRLHTTNFILMNSSIQCILYICYGLTVWGQYVKKKKLLFSRDAFN